MTDTLDSDLQTKSRRGMYTLTLKYNEIFKISQV